jgi:hypothetical protein
MGTLTLEQPQLRMHIAFDLILRKSCGWATLDSLDVSQLKFYADVAAPPPGLWRGPFYGNTGSHHHSSTTELLLLPIPKKRQYPTL